MAVVVVAWVVRGGWGPRAAAAGDGAARRPAPCDANGPDAATHNREASVEQSETTRQLSDKAKNESSHGLDDETGCAARPLFFLFLVFLRRVPAAGAGAAGGPALQDDGEEVVVCKVWGRDES